MSSIIDVLLVIGCMYLCSITYAQNRFEFDLSAGYSQSFDYHKAADVPLFTPKYGNIEGRLIFMKQLGISTHLSTGLSIGFTNARYRESNLINDIYEDYWASGGLGYYYASVPVQFDFRFSHQGEHSPWSIRGSLSPAWVFQHSIYVTEQLPDAPSNPRYNGQIERTRTPREHPTQLNFIYALGVDYRLSEGERWYHTIGLEGRVSDFGVYDDTPGIFQHGEWSINVAYRVGLISQPKKRRKQ